MTATEGDKASWVWVNGALVGAVRFVVIVIVIVIVIVFVTVTVGWL